MKFNFFQAVVMSILLYGCTRRMLIKCIEKKLEMELHKKATSYDKQILEATSHETTVVWPHTSYL